MMRWAVLAAAPLAICTLVPTRADACGQAECFDAARLTGEDGGIPANAPAVVLWPRTPYNAFNPVLDAGVSLHAMDGSVVPHIVERDGEGWRVRPVDGFVEGLTYVVRNGSTCEGGGSDGHLWPDASYEHTFVVGPSSPVPTKPGVLSLEGVSRENFGPYIPCSELPGGVKLVATFAFAVDESMAPWLPVTQWVLKVDDHPWAFRPYGRVDHQGNPIPDDSRPGTRRFQEVYSSCPEPYSPNPGLPEGRHVARLEAQIAGMDASLISNPVEFDLVCDAGVLDSGTHDAGDVFLPAALEAAGPASGCQSTGGGALLALGGLALLAWRRCDTGTNRVPPAP